MDELTDAQRSELIAELHRLQGDLTDLLAPRQAEATVDLDQSAMGRVSRVDALQQQQMAQAQRRRHQLRLKQVVNALKRVDEEEYGDCLKCGDPIAYKRLKARPESACCVPCTSALGR